MYDRPYTALLSIKDIALLELVPLLLLSIAKGILTYYLVCSFADDSNII